MATATKKQATNVRAEAQERPEIPPAKAQPVVGLHITPPNFLILDTTVVGTAPLVVHRFGPKARKLLGDRQKEGSQAKKGRMREPKDFAALYEESKHAFADGSGCGIPAAAFRSALVSACKLVGFHMTKAKIGLFVVADGADADGIQLVRITKGEPRQFEAPVRLESGVADIRVRALWEAGWECRIRVKYDADMFSASDVLNLLDRAGQQIGVCEGRPDSKKSAGQGWGMFEVTRG